MSESMSMSVSTSISSSNPTGRRIRRLAGSRMRAQRRQRMRQLMPGLLLGLLVMAGVAGDAGANDATRLDLNRATAAQLEALPGIGRSKAAAIVAARKQGGGFRSVGDLEDVRGIGPVLLEKLRPLVRVGAAPAAAAGSTSKAPAAARR